MKLILMMSTILSRHSNAIVEANFVGTKGAYQVSVRRLLLWCFKLSFTAVLKEESQLLQTVLEFQQKC